MGGAPRAVAFGVSGAEISGAEARFLASADPWGFILFRRNCQSREQLGRLVSDLREVSGRADVAILVDQEGGRVQRLGPPAWRPLPAPGRFGALARVNRKSAQQAARLMGAVLAAELRLVGITVNCVPVADVLGPDTTTAIGDRAFGDDPLLVAELSRALASGLLEGGVLPVIKHLPGHGSSHTDSHLGLTSSEQSLERLQERDFLPFCALQSLPLAMVNHLTYMALDPLRSASTSPLVIEAIIRRQFGFDGLLLSDDIGMAALQGTSGERAQAVLAAGCDVVLHCTGDLAEMEDVATSVGRMTPLAVLRWQRAVQFPALPVAPVGLATLYERLDQMMAVLPGRAAG